MAPPQATSIHLHEVQHLPIGRLLKAPWNANVVPPGTLDKIRNSLHRYGSVENSVVRPSWCRGTRTSHEVRARKNTQMGEPSTWETLSGNHRLGIYQDEGVETVPCVVVELSDPEAKVLAQVLNRTRGEDDAGLKADLLRDVATTMSAADISSLLPETPQDIARLLGGPGASAGEGLPSGTTGEYQPVPMVEQFVVPPFSVLDMRQGYWRKRKQGWLNRGVCADEERGDVLPTQSEGANPELSDQATHGVFQRRATGGGYTGSSTFDPVVCELAVRWFSPSTGAVLDPFAGGSTAGMVAAILGRKFTGIDLQKAQVEANRARAEERLFDTELPMPVWLEGDSLHLQRLTGGAEFDLVFTCPPYADLEQYSDDPRDISTMDYSKFLETYRRILARAVAQLRPNRFAVAVVGEVRDENGRYRNFVGDTVAAFEDAGAAFYNEAILVTPVGSLPLRAGRFFRGSRKLGKHHQQMLVFVKGSPEEATVACGTVDVALPREG